MAAEPKGTALAVIDWQPDRATLVDLHLEVTDQTIVEASGDVTKLGIDCALGWPVDFVNFIAGQIAHAGQIADASSTAAPELSPFSGDLDLRRRLAYRETDRQVRAHTGRWPLSVSTDRLAMTAIRAAGILSQLTASGFDTDRAGSGFVVEVYPAASLRQWGFEFAGYRASPDLRAELLAQLESRANWLSVGKHRDALIASCDAFDSLLAALATRAAQLGRYFAPVGEQLELARREGWIALPNSPLEDLLEPVV